MKVKEEGLQQVYRLHRYHHSDFWRPPLPSIHPESSANTIIFPSTVGETHQSLLRRQTSEIRSLSPLHPSRLYFEGLAPTLYQLRTLKSTMSAVAERLIQTFKKG
ncbi:hypothetical protein BT69DRAFT_1276844 [Atractiella rhizophila]|nr:hypothetical protein BT69DRAFT_1276844 [Atractiella rhizophila]